MAVLLPLVVVVVRQLRVVAEEVQCLLVVELMPPRMLLLHLQQMMQLHLQLHLLLHLPRMMLLHLLHSRLLSPRHLMLLLLPRLRPQLCPC